MATPNTLTVNRTDLQVLNFSFISDSGQPEETRPWRNLSGFVPPMRFATAAGLASRSMAWESPYSKTQADFTRSWDDAPTPTDRWVTDGSKATRRSARCTDGVLNWPRVDAPRFAATHCTASTARSAKGRSGWPCRVHAMHRYVGCVKRTNPLSRKKIGALHAPYTTVHCMHPTARFSTWIATAPATSSRRSAGWRRDGALC